jgi:DNA end-binding protein Ku
MKPYDPELGLVERSDLVKGYEYEKSHYVIIEPEDIEQLESVSDHTLPIDQFVDVKEVDPVYLDSPYYLAPDGPVAEETYRVIHEAMRRKGKAALGRIVMQNREHQVLIVLRDKGFLMTTLRAAQEVKSHEQFFEDVQETKADKGMLDLAGQLIEQSVGKLDPSTFKDRYQEALLEVVKAKIKGEKPVIAAAPERGKVVNLMDALTQSLNQGETKMPPAKSKKAARKPAKKKRA